MPSCKLIGALVTAPALVSSCVSPPAALRYDPPAAGVPAAVIVHLPHSYGLLGRAAMIDRKETPAFDKQVQIAEGTHSVMVECGYTSINVVGVIAAGPTPLPLVDAHSNVDHVMLTGPFVAGHTYHIRCLPREQSPHVFLAESVDGPPLPQFQQ